MKKIKLIFAAMTLAFFVITASGCAVVSTLVSAGIAYGIYQATKK